MTPAEKGRDVLGSLDLVVLYDLAPKEGCADCDDSSENAHMGHPIYYIGWPQELAAGIYGGRAECAPNFETAEQALEWAADHEEVLLGEFPS